MYKGQSLAGLLQLPLLLWWCLLPSRGGCTSQKKKLPKDGCGRKAPRSDERERMKELFGKL